MVNLTATPLRQERLRRGWSLVQLCRVTGISPTDLSLLERGMRPAFPGWQRRLAEAYELPAETLFPSKVA
jgi:transcriptional regulator with XRE-family HTH domain